MKQNRAANVQLGRTAHWLTGTEWEPSLNLWGQCTCSNKHEGNSVFLKTIKVSIFLSLTNQVLTGGSLCSHRKANRCGHSKTCSCFHCAFSGFLNSEGFRPRPALFIAVVFEAKHFWTDVTRTDMPVCSICTGKANSDWTVTTWLGLFLQPVFPRPAGLWDWVLGKQDSIADHFDVLHKHFIDGPLHYIPNLYVW